MATTASSAPRRDAPFSEEPGFYADAGLWLYGNARLLGATLFSIPLALGKPDESPSRMERIDSETENAVLAGKVLVTGIHGPAHRRAAVVPLRWGAPRILVFSGGFFKHLGPDLKEEPFREARLWRYQFDARTDLVVSARAPDKLPTYACFNPAVDRLIEAIASREVPGLLFQQGC